MLAIHALLDMKLVLFLRYMLDLDVESAFALVLEKHLRKVTCAIELATILCVLALRFVNSPVRFLALFTTVKDGAALASVIWAVFAGATACVGCLAAKVASAMLHDGWQCGG